MWHCNAYCSPSQQQVQTYPNQRNLKGTPQELKHLAYIVFVRSGMKYSSTIWDPHLIKDSDALERVQMRAARLPDGLQISTTGLQLVSLLQHLHLEPLEERRRNSRLTFLYKILNEHVAVPMNHLDLVLCDRPVRGSTTKQKLKIPRCAVPQPSSRRLLLQELLLSGTHCRITPPRWLRYRLSEAGSLPYRARRRAHFIAVISTRRLAIIIIQIQIQIQGPKVPPMKLSLPGAKVRGNECSIILLKHSSKSK